MIEARKSNAFTYFFHIYNRRLLRRSFHQIMLSKDSYQPINTQSCIYIVNHSCWWDGLIVFHLNQTILKIDGIVMMGREGLAKYPFFRKLGAFSVDTSSPGGIKTSLAYATRQLAAGKQLFMFPQGEETHLEKRPLRFFSGVAYLHQKLPEVPVVPILFYHGLFHHQLPDWYIHIGQPLMCDETCSKKEITRYYEAEVEQQLDSLKARVVSDSSESFTPILRGRKRIHETWGNLMAASRRHRS